MAKLSRRYLSVAKTPEWRNCLVLFFWLGCFETKTPNQTLNSLLTSTLCFSSSMSLLLLLLLFYSRMSFSCSLYLAALSHGVSVWRTWLVSRGTDFALVLAVVWELVASVFLNGCLRFLFLFGCCMQGRISVTNKEVVVLVDWCWSSPTSQLRRVLLPLSPTLHCSFKIKMWLFTHSFVWCKVTVFIPLSSRYFIQLFWFHLSCWCAGLEEGDGQYYHPCLGSPDRHYE